jgi:uncharacterized membrane protein
MGALTVWTFDTADGAAGASRTLGELASEDVVVVHAAATVSWETGERKPTTHQLHDLPAAGAMRDALWGLLFGVIFFVPLIGAAIGAPSGALSGSLSDVGIDDTFINRVRDQVTPGTSALFLMSSDAGADVVGDALAGHRPSGLLSAHLSAEQEDALREVFAE